ncbi:MAG: aldose epimerase family protein [Christensenellales bacterium]|nr:aldose epimerase family protein [Christensenellales bacterium]
MSIAIQPYGKAPSGAPVELYTMTNTSGASVSIASYGGIIVAIRVPDRRGELNNVVLGYPGIEGYTPLHGYLGALIGRVGNRIGKGEFELNGKQYRMAKNENGKTHLHGGAVGFDRRIWEVTPVEGICQDSLILKYTSPDGEENYPGTLRVMVTYTFTDENELILRYEAVADADTPCCLTNHVYFNLAGEGSGPIDDHVFEINSDTFTVVDADFIPTGEQRDVTGTPFDLRQPVRFGDRGYDLSDEQMAFALGYDHNFNICDYEVGMRFAAGVSEPVTGRTLDVFTDMPAVQFYAGNQLEGINPGFCGRPYGKNEGFCLETQYAPDSVNHPEWMDTILRAGEKYDFTTVFSFGVQAD